MKFTEGMWQLKTGYKVDWMANVERTSRNGDTLRLLLTKPQNLRGDSLNTATFTTHITSPANDVIGMKHVHWNGEDEVGPHFELNCPGGEVNIRDIGKGDETWIRYTSSNLSLNINTSRNKFAFDFKDERDRKVTSHSVRSLGYVRDERAAPWEDGMFRERQGFMLAELDIGVGEQIYGLGERFGPFVKNGQSIEMSNEDGGTSSDLAYKNIPFYLSSKGYGVFVRDTGKVSFEVQSERTTRVNISVIGEKLEYYIIYGASPKDIISKYTVLTGRPPVPPAWSYNLWLSTSFTTNYNEETVTSFLDGFAERGIPLGTFHFDCFWMKSFQWCDFEFDRDMFPDAKGYLSRLKKRGLKICVWINPYIGQDSPLFEEGKKNGYFVRSTTRKGVWQWDEWQAGMALVDFTNPSACQWYKSYLAKLVDMGVDAFKTDFGEQIPRKNISYHNGADPERMHNYYTHLYNKTTYEVIQEKLGTTQGCLFARSATTGGQTLPVHWSGDCECTFEAMAETLRGGLSLSLGGFGFWAHDIGGFEGTPSPALYKRWCQFGLLSSHSRLHGSGSYRVPWLFDSDTSSSIIPSLTCPTSNLADPSASAVLRDCVLRKIALTPYLLSLALSCHKTGIPLLRATFLEYPHDRTSWDLDTQCFLGSNLLVAPVFCKEGEVRFYVPEEPSHGREGIKKRDEKGEGEGEGEEEGGNIGKEDGEKKSKWVSWFDHSKTYIGGKWYTETHGFDTLPLLIRPGTVTPVNWSIKSPEEDFTLNGLEVLVNGPIRGILEVQLVDSKSPENVKEVLKLESKGESGEVVVSREGVKVTVVG